MSLDKRYPRVTGSMKVHGLGKQTIVESEQSNNELEEIYQLSNRALAYGLELHFVFTSSYALNFFEEEEVSASSDDKLEEIS